MTIRKSATLALACLLSSTALNSYGENLLQVYELALENDHQFKADVATYNAGLEASSIAKGALLPQINATAAYQDQSTDASSTSISADGETDTETTSYGITLQQSLINFSALNSYRSAKLTTSAAEAQFAANQQSLIVRSAQAYFDVLSSIDQQRTSKALEKALAAQLEQTRQRYEVGLISINDVHETQAAYDSAVADRLTADVNVGIQLEALAIITGQYLNRIAPLKENFTASYPSPNDKQEWISSAESNNLSLRVSKLNADIAKYDAKASRSDRYPELTGTISYGNSDSETSGDSNVETDTDTTTFRLDLSVPLYSGGRLSAVQRQQAQLQIQARENYLLTYRNIIQQTRSLFLSVSTDIARIKARKQAIVSSQSALEATQAGYDAGTRDIVDVVNAQGNLYQAQLAYYSALYEYIINTLNLKQMAGSLSEADLEMLNNELQSERSIAF